MIFMHGNIVFVFCKEKFEEDMEPPLSATDTVRGLHAASVATDYPSDTNQMLTCIMKGQWVTANSVIKTPEDFRGHMTAMLALDFLAPWVNEDTIKGVFRTACDATIDLLYTNAISDSTEESLVVNGKRKRDTVDYDEVKRARIEGDEEESEESEESEENDDEEDSEYSSSGSESEEDESDDDESGTKSSDSDCSGSELDVSEEQDPYLYTHERMRGFALCGAVDTDNWKTVFAEWWDRVFERRLMDDPDLAAKIWPAMDDYCERYSFGGKRKTDPNNLNKEIAKICNVELKRIQASTAAKDPLKATRLAASMNMYADCTKDSKHGFEHYNFHLGYTQPLPFYKRTKVNQDEDQHKFAVSRRVNANPILHRVTGGAILKVVIDRMEKQFGVKVEPAQVLFGGGFGSGTGWLLDFENKPLKRSIDIIILKDAELRTKVTSVLKRYFEDISRLTEVCMPWSGDESQIKADLSKRLNIMASVAKSLISLDDTVNHSFDHYFDKKEILGYPGTLHSFYHKEEKANIIDKLPDFFDEGVATTSPVFALTSLCFLGVANYWSEYGSKDWYTVRSSCANRIRDRMNKNAPFNKNAAFELIESLVDLSYPTIVNVLSRHSKGEHITLLDELKVAFSKVKFFGMCWCKGKGGHWRVPRDSIALRKSLERVQSALDQIDKKYIK